MEKMTRSNHSFSHHNKSLQVQEKKLLYVHLLQQVMGEDSHVENDQSDVVEEQNTSCNRKTSDSKKVAYYKLFSFADSLDYALMGIGVISSIGIGLCLPLMTLLFGQLANSFGHNFDTPTLVSKVSEVSLKFVYLALGSGVAAFSQVSCWLITGERQAVRIRNLYLKAILRQDIGYFDKETSTGEIVERISSHTGIIQDAIGEKVGKFLQLSSSFIGGFVIAFSKGWLLTLVLLSAIPVLVLSAAVMTVMMAKLMSRGHAAYSEAAVVVEQTIASIRTVASFTGEKKAVDKYEKSLHKAYRASVQEGLAAGLGSGVFMLVLFCSYALAVWFGARMIINNGYSGGAVLNITMAVLLGSFSLGQISPCLTAFGAGQDVAFKVFETIHRKPEIDPYDTNGHVMSNLKGDVELRDVYFSYPTRPDEQILTSFSLTIPSGTTLALVGESGSGKSTIINLIERFYDPQHGEVLIDGVNVKEFRVGWIRGRIGLVSQEPVLFDSSIMENIAYGKTGASVEEIRVAAECAHAAKFIDKLPQGLDTLVGVNGNQLSGGQKQRIALARAILKDSKILLLDEATSALDAESEKIVQAALDRVTTNRTTIIVAHRLSTVKNADAIAVIRHGNVAEKGSHSELIRNPHGEYTRLVRLQDDDSFSIDKTARNHEETRDTDRKKTNQDFKTEVIRNPADDDDDISTDSFSIDQTASYHEETHTTDHMKMNQDFKTEAIRKPADDDESFSIDRTTPYHEETHTTDHKKKMNQDFKTDATQKPEDDDDSLSIDRTTPYHEETHTTNHNKTNQAIQKSDDDMNNSHHHSISIDKTASYHEETHNKTNQVSLYRLARLNKPEIPDLILGSIAAIINGSILPLFGLLFASVVKTFFEPHHKLQSDSKFWACMFVVLGTASFLATPTRTYFFAVAGSKLIKRLRLMCFAKVVHMEIGWFDLAENSSAVIGSRLSVDVKCVRNLVGESLALIVQNVATAVAGLVIGFGASWELSIVVLFMLPLIGLNGYLHMKFVTGFSADSKKLYEEATQVASDAVGNIRTVASFCAEEKVMELHQKKCAGPVKLSIRHGLLSGAGFGMSFFLLYSVYAASYYAGARLVEARRISFGDVFRVFLGLSMTAVGISQSGALAPDSGKARVSAASIFELIDHKSKIDSTDDSGMMLETVKGDITFQHVSFRYPNRPDVEILKDLSLTIQSGKMVAIVGESGSGKSTIISLLQRFYDPDSGQITIDGVEIQKLKLKWLRQQIGLVSQEPVLFNDTIRANIEYGKEENASEVEILAAAKLANADNFITALHKGYDKVVGERGIQLSGGQKQRVAIARALLKDPKILLLDEATSALDAESEKVVQDALERAMVDRTTIVVAHRLSTIKNADLIVVLKNGVVVEKGKHEALINKKHGFYVSLVSLPNVSTS